MSAKNCLFWRQPQLEYLLLYRPHRELRLAGHNTCLRHGSNNPAFRSKDEQAWRKHWHSYNEFYHRVDAITEEITATQISRFDANNSTDCAVAVSESGEVIGFATWYPHPFTGSIEDNIYLNDLFVEPTSRNGGVGRKLIEYVYAEADKRGIKTVYWHTQYFNHRAQLLYTKVGQRTDFIRYDRP